MEKTKEKATEVELNEQERRLIQIIRELDSGQLKISVSDSVPTFIEEIRENIPLG